MSEQSSLAMVDRLISRILALLLGVSFSLLAQQSGISIRGTVKTQNGETLPGAYVVVVGTQRGTACDIEGRFVLQNLAPGTYTLQFSYMGCKGVKLPVTVRAGATVECHATLEEDCFKIGEIVVIGTRELLPSDPITKTQISSAEIEHMQATSIGDVLDLVPGVQKTSNPGLSKTSQVAIRGMESDNLSAFGTLVLLDGIPMSNNANLQFERLSGATAGSSNMGGGADLRLIPADNIENIEITRGIPSVRYGDVTAGVINIRTKIGPQPHRLKIKNNPDTREGNLGGGMVWEGTGVTYNLNLAQSERDIRKTGDEYSRLTAQVVTTNTFLENSLTLNNKFYAQKVFDEEQPKGDVLQTKNFNRGFNLTYGLWGKYEDTEVSRIDFSTFLTYRRENSMKSRIVQSDLRILPNGDTVSIYLGKVETRGHEWNTGGRLEYNRTIITGAFVHKFLLGTDLQYNANTGEGILVDSLYNYYGSQSGKRSYSFDDIPDQLLANLYVEDQISGLIGWDFTLTLGARYEMYRPFKFNLKGLWANGDLFQSHQGSFFNPRMNLVLYLSKDNQLRISGGYTSKSPPMSNIYPPPEVFNWRDPVSKKTIQLGYDRCAADLKGYREGQVELSYDQRFIDLIGISASGYYKKRSNEPESQTIPVFISSTVNNRPTIYYVDEYSISQNLGWTESKGIEFSLKSNKIDALNMEFQLTASYNFFKRSRSGFDYNAYPDTSLGYYPNYVVPGVPTDTTIGRITSPTGRWDDKILLNYFIRYTVPKLGLWVTLRAEQNLQQRYQNFSLIPIDYARLTETELRDRLWEESMKVTPPKWLFNINISKSLYRGAEVSIFVNNVLDNSAVHRRQRTGDPTDLVEDIRNPELFYGIEFSMSFSELFK
ncbi:MAG: TonB-dependent receptor [bacterium]